MTLAGHATASTLPNFREGSVEVNLAALDDTTFMMFFWDKTFPVFREVVLAHPKSYTSRDIEMDWASYKE